MSPIDTGILFAYMVMILGLGVYAHRQQQDVEDYYVAGRRMGTLTIACLWMASWIGGAAIVGASSRAFEMGVTSIWYITALALACLAFGVLVAARIKREGDAQAHLTFPDYVEYLITLFRNFFKHTTFMQTASAHPTSLDPLYADHDTYWRGAVHAEC